MKKKLKVRYGKIGIALTIAAVLLIGADLLTKWLEEKYCWDAVIIPGFIEIKHHIHNPAIAFSFLGYIPKNVLQPILIAFTILMSGALVFAFLVIPERFVILKIAIAFLFAGAVGNLYDRIFMPYYVRDWFGLNMFGSMAYCNFADFWIVIGAILAAVDLLFLNEYSVFPLTKSAREAQRARKEADDKNQAKIDKQIEEEQTQGDADKKDLPSDEKKDGDTDGINGE